jgi:hypothetical protein
MRYIKNITATGLRSSPYIGGITRLAILNTGSVVR